MILLEYKRACKNNVETSKNLIIFALSNYKRVVKPPKESNEIKET